MIEEKILSRYQVVPLKAVGLEGIFGLVIVSLAIPILHFTLGITPSGVGNQSIFDMYESFRQIMVPQVLISAVGICFSIAFFNYFGLTVTKYISATSRSTIDTCRTLFIWMVSLSLRWETFKWLQVN